MKLYMAVTADKYELPLFVSENPMEVAEKFHVSYNNFLSCISKKKNGRYSGHKFLRIEVEE